jgi:hypothetical protein
VVWLGCETVMGCGEFPSLSQEQIRLLDDPADTPNQQEPIR